MNRLSFSLKNILTATANATTAFAIAALLSTALVGCKSSKPAVAVTDYSASTATQRFEALVAQSGQWNEMNIPLKLELRSPMNLNVSGKAYMRRDKDIYISIRFLGLEVGSLYVNADSVYASYKPGKVYLAEPIGSLLSGASVTVSDIQDILLGRVFVNGQGGLDLAQLDMLSIGQDNDSWTITPRKKVAGASYAFRLSNADNCLESMEVTSGDKSVAVRYSEPADTRAGIFMGVDRLKTSLTGKPIDATIKWNLSGIKWEVDSTVKWRQPSGYRRIDASKLLKSIQMQ